MKLTPNVADPAAVAVAAEEGGADAVSLINTLKASAIDPRDPASRGSPPATAASRARRCGPSRSRRCGRSAAAVGIPAIGMGGVCNGADALELLAAGARVVAVGTESFRDPLAGRRVAAELAELLTEPLLVVSVTRPRLEV